MDGIHDCWKREFGDIGKMQILAQMCAQINTDRHRFRQGQGVRAT